MLQDMAYLLGFRLSEVALRIPIETLRCVTTIFVATNTSLLRLGGYWTDPGGKLQGANVREHPIGSGKKGNRLPAQLPLDDGGIGGGGSGHPSALLLLGTAKVNNARASATAISLRSMLHLSFSRA
jgi:hypothetical protein